MTVYKIPNIKHCDVIPVDTIGFSINSHKGWYIHINDGDESSVNVYKTAVVLLATFDFSTVDIVEESDLPEDAEILGIAK